MLESSIDICDKKSLTDDALYTCDGKGGELRMGKKLVSLSAITLFAFTLTFVGCGKKEEPAPPPPPPAPAAPAEPAAPPAGDQLWHRGGVRGGRPGRGRLRRGGRPTAR